MAAQRKPAVLRTSFHLLLFPIKANIRNPLSPAREADVGLKSLACSVRARTPLALKVRSHVVLVVLTPLVFDVLEVFALPVVFTILKVFTPPLVFAVLEVFAFPIVFTVFEVLAL